jgi:hypothetical protein
MDEKRCPTFVRLRQNRILKALMLHSAAFSTMPTAKSQSTSMPARRRRISLYWVQTPDHREDWLVYACSSRQAREFFEEYEGYSPGDAKASLVCAVDDNSVVIPSWVDHEDLSRFGVKAVHEDYPEVYERGGVRYRKGCITYEVYTALTDNISGLYVIQMRDTRYFKIGVTTHLRNRIRNLKTANPNQMVARYFVEVKSPSVLESKLHRHFRRCRREGEWFLLNADHLNELRHILARDIRENGGRFHLGQREDKTF